MNNVVVEPGDYVKYIGLQDIGLNREEFYRVKYILTKFKQKYYSFGGLRWYGSENFVICNCKNHLSEKYGLK